MVAVFVERSIENVGVATKPDDEPTKAPAPSALSSAMKERFDRLGAVLATGSGVAWSSAVGTDGFVPALAVADVTPVPVRSP